MVSGFTDDRQVRGGNRQFADNWELSAQRALTVTRALIEEGVPSGSVFAAAFGSEQAVASNADADGRSQQPARGNGADAEAVQREHEVRVSNEEPCAAGAMIDAWRERGDHRFDPVRFRFIEALARRAGAHRGDARRILDDKLARLLAAYGEDVDKAASAKGAASTAAPQRRSALADLVDHAARHAPAECGRRSATSEAPGPGSTPTGG